MLNGCGVVTIDALMSVAPEELPDAEWDSQKFIEWARDLSDEELARRLRGLPDLRKEEAAIHGEAMARILELLTAGSPPLS